MTALLFVQENATVSLLVLKNNIRRKLQHLIASLKTNEIPLRHISFKLDGRTLDPNIFADLIVTRLMCCEKIHVALVRIYSCFMNIRSAKGIRFEHKSYLYYICVAISTVQCSRRFENREPGPIAKICWITTSCEIFCLYVSK